MVAISIKVTNDDTPELFQKLEAGLGRFVKKGSAYIEGQLKVSMAGAKSGRMYGTHQASAPGESPAVDSGNLAGSISVIMASSLEAKIGTNVEYATYLENGTSRMAQRPLWEKTATESIPMLEEILRTEIGR